MVQKSLGMSDLVALDATVLTNFALVNRPDLIERLWPGNAVTTAAAMLEYQAGVASRQLPENCWAGLPVVELSLEESNLASRLPKNLGAGERACIQADLLTLRDANLLLAQMAAAGYRTPVQRIDELL
jgi:predicted nucleic acid-binding protein